MCLLGLLFYNSAGAQNIRGDTIYVDENSVVAILFSAVPRKADLSMNDGQGGLYEVKVMGKKSLSIKALKKEARDQFLEVDEGDKEHLLILSYKEGSPARTIDWSTKRKLTARANEVKRDVTILLNRADSLYGQAKNNISNQAMWEEVSAKYSPLAIILDSKDRDDVRSKLEESSKRVEGIKENKYGEALKEGQNYYGLQKYSEARKAYQKALEYKPGDIQALKYISLTDSVWAKVYVDKGDEANKAKRYVYAMINYQEARRIKADYPLLENKFNQAKESANPIVYEAEKKKGDQAMKANDIVEARRAYDSALSARPDDRYIKSQVKNLIIEEEKIEQEERKEATYQSILVQAKGLADKASNVQGFDSAIKEYEKAISVIPDRKFPRKKIAELRKKRGSSRSN